MKDMLGSGDFLIREHERWMERLSVEQEMLEYLRVNNWVFTKHEWASFKECADILKEHLTGRNFLNIRSLGHLIETLEEIPQLNFLGADLCSTN